MLASFTVEGGPALALTRGAADVALLSTFGALLARAWLAPPVLARLTESGGAARRLASVGQLSLAAAGLLSALWVALQSAELSGSVAGAPGVLGGTLFGHLVLARLGLLGLAAFLLGRGRFWAAAAAAGTAVASQAGHGHGLAMDLGPSWLLLSGALHLLAAAAWLGGLVPLLVLIASAPPAAAALASRRFSRLGTACVAVLAGTALYQGSVLVGSLPAWIGTGYGLVTLAKTALFLVLLAFAARHRFRLTPALADCRAVHAKGRLVRGIAAEAGVGLLVILAAGLLTSLPPGMHEQPGWPFPWRLNPDMADGALGWEALLAEGALGGAAIAVAAAFLVRRRARGVVLVGAIISASVAAPHLAMLLTEAYPTQYWRSPTGFASTAIAEGGALFAANCAACHGMGARGDGPAAQRLPVPPADLTSGHLWAHADGELFWWISQGIAAPGGGAAMPGFAEALTADQRWSLIDWLRANNAGTARAAAGAWSRPVQAPDVAARCQASGAVTLEDLRGQVLRVVFGPATALPDVLTLEVTSDEAARPQEGVCVIADPAVPIAYAAVSGLAPDSLADVQMLIDGKGWLRALLRPGAKPSWGEQDGLAGVVRSIKASPLAASPAGHGGMIPPNRPAATDHAGRVAGQAPPCAAGRSPAQVLPADGPGPTSTHHHTQTTKWE